MHKRIAAADLELDEVTGSIRKIGRIFASEHLPPGIPMDQGSADRAALNERWMDRSIPASRSGIREAMEILEIPSPQALLPRCYGLSLSDQYWICPKDTRLRWEDINFFTNTFSDDIGDVLFGVRKKADGLNFSSPDNPFRQQPFNEVIASGIMERLDISHVPYTLLWDQHAPYSVCENFVTKDTELIPAWRIYKTQKKDNSTSVYQHFVMCCEALGIEGAVPFLNRMMALDYMIANEDRHFNNFGVLRDAQSLEWLGFAPIYDSGSSLGYDKMAGQILTGKEVLCKPFKNHHKEQLALVSDLSWIRFDRLSDIQELMKEVFSAGEAADYIGKDRLGAIVRTTQQRIEDLSRLAGSHLPVQAASTKDDVKENIAENYLLEQ